MRLAAYEDRAMKIHVNRVPEEGLSRHESYDPAAMDMEREDIHLSKPFEVDAAIMLIDKELVVNADIRCLLTMACGRCMDDFESLVHVPAIFSYNVKITDVVDITEDVRQEIILAYPMIPVCREDCKGLCRMCGQNLNRGTCGHPTETKE